MGEFHAKDGWYFKRTRDGQVRIRHECERHDHCASNVIIEVDANTWASIVASVTPSGSKGKENACGIPREGRRG